MEIPPVNLAREGAGDSQNDLSQREIGEENVRLFVICKEIRH